MFKIFNILTLSLAFAGIAACGHSDKKKAAAPTQNPDGFSLAEDAGYLVKADWNTPLSAGGDGTNEVVLTFLAKDESTPTMVSLVAFHPRMPMMNNHGTDEDTQEFSAQSEAHVIKVSGIYFNMAGNQGEWVVTLTAKVNDITQDAKLNVPEVL